MEDEVWPNSPLIESFYRKLDTSQLTVLARRDFDKLVQDFTDALEKARNGEAYEVVLPQVFFIGRAQFRS